MSDTAIAYSRGGEHATARRSGIIEDVPFIQAKRRAGAPDSAIAQMIGRSLASVQTVPREEPPVRRQPPKQEPKPQFVLSLYKGLIPVPGAQEFRGGELSRIAQEVSARTGVSVQQLRGPQRARAVARARWEVMYLAYDTGRFSLPQIGAFLGGRDHTTVMHGCRGHADLNGLPQIVGGA